MKVVELGGDDTPDSHHTGIDCAMCLGSPPFLPSGILGSSPAPSPLAHSTAPVAKANLISLTAPPLPSRGPPRLS
jgi:hypothetical protein